MLFAQIFTDRRPLQFCMTGSSYVSRCLLASVTNYGCVLVHVPRSKRWLTAVDISSLWSKCCRQNWGVGDHKEGDDNDSNKMSVLQSRVEKLKATGQLFCYLLLPPRV